MDNVHSMWFFVPLVSLFGISFCSDCQHSALPSSTIDVSSSISSKYGKENVMGLSDTPWVGGTTEHSSNWISFAFPNPIQLTHLEMDGGYVDFYGNGTNVTCYVERFVLNYKNESGPWIRYPKFKNNVGGRHDKVLNISQYVTEVNITLKRYVGCPAVNLKLLACGLCSAPGNVTDQNVACTNKLQSCTYTCEPGLRSNYNKDAVKKCQLNGTWSGPNLTCVDVNECKEGENACKASQSCKNVHKSYECPCKTGYTGSLCKDIDECNTSDTCHELAHCTNTAGSYSCHCKSGYTRDGFNCSDIDECNTSDPCHKLAHCTNTAGSYSCLCKSGYTGDGFNCSDVNECQENKCHKYADCTNTVGSFECECKKDFEGDGLNCSGAEVRIEDFESPNVELRYGQKLELSCKAEGRPKPRFKWMTRNNVVSKEHVLIIERITLDDGGSYKCIAYNNETNDEKSINVTVIGTPTSPYIKHKKSSATSITVSWSKPDDEGASRINRYVLYYMTGANAGVEKSVKVSNVTLSKQIEDLKPNKEYVIWVVAENEQGKSSRMKNHAMVNAFTLAPKPDTLPQPVKSSVSSSSVKIKIEELKSIYNISKLEVIVKKVAKRRKRSSGSVPKNFVKYDEAKCKGTSGCYYIAAELKNEDREFIVGDGNKYGDYINAKLEVNTKYEIYMRGVSINSANPPEKNFGDLSEPLKIRTTTGRMVDTEESDSNVVGIAVGLTVLFVVLVVLVFLAVIYIRSRRPQTVDIDPETGEKRGRKKKINSELLPLTKKAHGKRKSGQVEDGFPDPNHPPVSTAGFAKYVGKLHKSDDRGFMIQYNTLETTKTYTSDFATSPENKEKNRYANIVAYDISRVHLKAVDDDDNSTYINASLVDGYNCVNAYIATQGPLPSTFNDFWRMVWERNCSSIVMLTNLQERHKLKCHKYWPEETETYGDITVTATRREQYADYVIRTFLLKMSETEEEREIKQFHFTVWPDHGVPEYPTAILAFQRRVRAYSTRDSGPLAVHCSAGVGRSGTFIVIDCMLARIQNEQTIDIYNYVRYLRTRRMYMVQTEQQYVFCHDALLESILCGNTQMAAHNLRIEMNRLRQRDPTTKLTGFESEFKTLSKVSPCLPKESFVVASYAENISKNRYPDILASDHGRVILGDDDDKEDGPYINAVYLDGYKQQNAFIVTQAPLKETVRDFWRMLYEKHSACVILLINITGEEEDIPQFWPDEGSEKYDSYDVELVSDVSKDDTGSEDQFQQEKMTGDIVERKFKLTKEEDKSFVVKMFQHFSWTEATVPSDISAIISLIQRIEKWQQHSGNGPITIVCNDGQGRSGTFAGLCSVLERVKTEQVVDVFQTIKALRIQRPGLVKHVEQYEFIHLGLQEYLDSFADYANFK